VWCVLHLVCVWRMLHLVCVWRVLHLAGVARAAPCPQGTEQTTSLCKLDIFSTWQKYLEFRNRYGVSCLIKYYSHSHRTKTKNLARRRFATGCGEFICRVCVTVTRQVHHATRTAEASFLVLTYRVTGSHRPTQIAYSWKNWWTQTAGQVTVHKFAGSLLDEGGNIVGYDSVCVCQVGGISQKI
jgi:hypothetical protein